MTTTILVLLLIVAVDISGSSAKTFTPPESVVKSLPFNNQNNSKYTESEQRVASAVELNNEQAEDAQNAKQNQPTDEEEKEGKNENQRVKSANSTPTPTTTQTDQKQATNEADTKIQVTPTVPMSTPSPTPIAPDTDNSCIASGGTWKDFPNSCVDSCALAEDPGLMCLQVITEGCDCGPNKCWDRESNSCVDNPSGVKIISPTIRIPPPIR